MKKILFVCLGNICRSPAAEGVLVHLLKEQGLEQMALVDSAGTSGFHSGEWPDERMIKAAQKRGIRLPTRSRQITESDLVEFDYILCMDKSNLTNVMKLSNAEVNKKKIKLFLEYRNNLSFNEVPDPYYGSEKDFELVLDIVTDAGLNFIKQEFKI